MSTSDPKAPPPPAATPATSGTSAIITTPASALTTSIQTLNGSLAEFLENASLPTQHILAPIEERRSVIDGLESALSILPIAERQKAIYLSRFIVAISVGLFDGALNYLWNETIGALRRLVAQVDLSYFFSIAGQINGRYASLTTEDDLREVSEHDLLEACRRIGLLTDVNFKRLEHVNFMRNHASAAHPNAVDLNGPELLSWLSNCLRYAITAELERSVVTIKRLLANIRSAAIPSADYDVIGGEIIRLSGPQIDDLVWALFGMYVDPRLPAQAKTNIQGVAGAAWSAATEDRRYEIGSRYGMFRKNADVDRKAAAEDFLTRVGGLQYRDEDSLAAELLARLQALKTAHYAWNNFYNEAAHAQMLPSSIPLSGKVPRAVRPLWVKVLSTCYIGNGMGFRQGTDEGAVPYYEQCIATFGEPEVAEFLHLFADTEFTSPLSSATPDRRARILAGMLKARTSNVHHIRALDEIISFTPRKLDAIALYDSYKRLLASSPKHA